jgi:hypothetical protein
MTGASAPGPKAAILGPSRDVAEGPGADLDCSAGLVQGPAESGSETVRKPPSPMSRFSTSNSRKYLSGAVGTLPHVGLGQTQHNAVVMHFLKLIR